MRVAIASPTWERVPPPAYGGIEAVVGLVADGLVNRGHDVTLYATGDSLTTARLRSVSNQSLRSSRVDQPLPYQLAHVATVLTEADQYDIIHNHCGELLMAFANLTSVPMLTTIHGPMVPDSQIVWDQYNGYYNTISIASKNGFPDRGYLGVVYNGIDVDSFPFSRDKGDYLLFLGRLSAEKGPHLAIQVARAIGQRLVIAGKVDQVDQRYFDTDVAPLLEDSNVSFVGEADAVRKRDLFAGARCLLHPVTWPEPFGLVMAEAMACGTPVVAFGRGSIPEVVVHGETGFVVDSVDGMIDAIHHLSDIDPARCRSWVAERFSADRMVAGYEELYQRIRSGTG